MKRWLVDGRFFLYALTSGEAQQRVARHLTVPVSTLAVEPAGHYTRIGNQIIGGPATSPAEGRDA